jgi:hypothetical protein
MGVALNGQLSFGRAFLTVSSAGPLAPRRRVGSAVPADPARIPIQYESLSGAGSYLARIWIRRASGSG